MENQVACPNCQLSMPERELVVTSTLIIEACPRCKAEVRRGERWAWRDADAITQEDVASIDGWLEEIAQSQNLGFTRNRQDEDIGDYLWEIAGKPLPWECFIYYSTKMPHVVQIRLASDQEPAKIFEQPKTLLTVCHDHGVQSHAHAEGTLSGDGIEQVEAGKWGAGQILATGQLTPALFHVVLKRLVQAMESAASRFGIRIG
jgi:hypothetical protein